MSKYRVLFAGSNSPGRLLAPCQSEVTVGRKDSEQLDWQPAIDLSLDPQVSRRHARLVHEAGQWLIEDLGSKHGTRLDGVEIQGRGVQPYELGTPVQTGQTVWAMIPEDWFAARLNGVWIFGAVAHAFNLAGCHCGLPILGPVQVWNGGARASSPGLLRWEIEGWTGQAMLEVPALQLGGRQVLEMAQPRVNVMRLQAQGTPEKGAFHLTDAVGNRRLVDLGAWVLGSWDWPVEPEYLTSLAAYVCPRHPAVEELVLEAEARLPGSTFAELVQGRADAAERDCVRVLYESLNTRHVQYVPPERSELRDPPARYQTVRPPHEILPAANPGRGTCLDLSILLAAAMERVGLQPLVVVTGDETGDPQHALVGCWLGASAGYEPVLAGAQRLRSLAAEDILVVDSTGAAWKDDGSGPAMSFHQARQSAWGALERAPWAAAVNICALRPPVGRIIPIACLEDPAVARAYLAAKSLAHRQGRDRVETAHLLYGLLDARGEIMRWLCEKMALNLDDLRSQLASRMRQENHAGDPQPTRNFLECQQLAQQLAWEAGSSLVREADLIQALFGKAERSESLQQACQKLGLDRAQLLRLLEDRFACPPRPESKPLKSSSPPDGREL